MLALLGALTVMVLFAALFWTCSRRWWRSSSCRSPQRCSAASARHKQVHRLRHRAGGRDVRFRNPLFRNHGGRRAARSHCEPILRAVGLLPIRIVVGTALLAWLIHLDGSGAVCSLITIPAMLPLYDQLGMDAHLRACATAMAAGVNLLPWTGPMLRASAALKIPATLLFQPMIPIQVIGLVYFFAVA